jgi:hypothetical protein
MTKYGSVTLIAIGLICWTGTAFGPTLGAQAKGIKYASERSPYPFVGATRVAVEGFDPSDNDPMSAMLQMDKNEVTFSSYGEPRITTVFYKAVPVKLTRLDQADPTGMDRRIYSVEMPKEFSADLGKNAVRLVTTKATKSEPAGIRLLLVNPDKVVTQVVELRPVATN